MPQTVTSPTAEDELPIAAFDRNTTDEDLLRAYHRFEIQEEAEHSPDDPPPSYEQMIAGLRNVPPFMRSWIWIMQQPDGEIVASSGIGILNTPENQHPGQFGISVRPALRRRRIGTRLLREIVAVA